MEKDSFSTNMDVIPETQEPEELKSSSKNNGEKIMRVLELAKLTETRKDEDAFNASLQDLTRDGAYRYLRMINGMLRGVNAKERGVRSNVRVGDHMAPDLNTQGIILKDTVEALKNIDNNHYRAALAYYTVNNLHLFADGNGRTSRAVYEMFDNPEFNLGSDEFMHKTSSSNESGSHANFEKKHHIVSTESAYANARYLFAEEWAKENKIDPRILKLRSRVEIIFGETPDIYLTEDAEQNLTAEEKKAINSAFHDGDIALLALCRMLKIKETSDAVMNESIRTKGDKQYIAIEVSKDDIDTGKPNVPAMHTFEGWTAEDYRTFVKGFRYIQKTSQRVLNDIFMKPEEYKISDGRTYAEWLTNTSN